MESEVVRDPDPREDEASSDVPSGPPLRTITFLCTDIEGSTQLWDEQPDAMREALARHDALLSDAVRAHDGQIFKTTGDGAYATMPGVADAIRAAVHAAHALAAEPWDTTGPLAVRMSIHTGEVQERDGDYYGPALNRTSRLMAASHGGQILLTSASAALVRDELDPDFELLDLGLHRLRGIAAPEHVYQLRVPGLRADFPPLQTIDTFPAGISGVRSSFSRGDIPLAGRSRELDRLARVWRQAAEGTAHLVLLSGEAGIGKTRLVGELTTQVEAERGAVLYGRCDEDSVVPYQPFVEALQPYVAATPAASLHQRLHGLERDLTRLFPELAGRILDHPLPAVSDPEAERFRLFEAVGLLVSGIAAVGSAVLVVDDLHWADRPTLQLLRHVVRSASDAPLLVVLAYREADLADDREAGDLVVDLQRDATTERITLQGLPEVDVATMLGAIAGHDVAPPLARTLHHETGGNPFFLSELMRNLLETEPSIAASRGEDADLVLGDLSLPQSVRDVVTRRVQRLPEPVGEVLAVAAVMGREFAAAPLVTASARSPDEVLGALDLAKAAGIVDEQGDQFGTYRFSHDLVCQVLYATLGTARAAQLHARVGAALEGEPSSKASPAVLAEHYSHALVLGEAPKALHYMTAAGHEAATNLAFEDAVAHFEQAVALVDQYFPDDDVRRAALLIDLAEVLVFVDEAAGVTAALRAVEAARAGGSAEQLGRAVAVFAEPLTSVLKYPGLVDELFAEAQQALDDEHPALRARLIAIEAFKHSAYQLPGRGADGSTLAAQAVRLAREAAHAPTLTAALFARATSLESTPLIDERRALGEELVELGRAGGSRAPMATTQGLRVLAGVHLELGDAHALDSAIAELGRTGEQARWLPALVFEAQWRATQALLEGRFDDVRSHWGVMRRYSRAYRAVSGMEAQQGYYLARERGELAPLVDALDAIAEEVTDSLYVPAMLAVARLETGDQAGARRILDTIGPDDLRRAEHENALGAALALLSEVAAATSATEHAALLHDMLEPFAGRIVATVIGLACLGAADRYRGMLCTTLERWDDAEEHLSRAVAVEERIRGRALLVRTRCAHAELLRARGRPSDTDAAIGLLTGVVDEARDLGMAQLRERAMRLLAR